MSIVKHHTFKFKKKKRHLSFPYYVYLRKKLKKWSCCKCCKSSITPIIVTNAPAGPWQCSISTKHISLCCLRPAANTAGWMRATAHYWTAGLMGWPESCNIVISEYYGLHNIVLRITPLSPWVAPWPDLTWRASKGFNRIPSGVNISFFVNTHAIGICIFLSVEFRLTGMGSSVISPDWAQGQDQVLSQHPKVKDEPRQSGVRAQERRAGIRRSLCQITWHPRCRVKCSHSDGGKKRRRCKSGYGHCWSKYYWTDKSKKYF